MEPKAELWWAVAFNDLGKCVMVCQKRRQAEGMVETGPKGCHVEPVSVVRDGGKLAKGGKG
jgi:hypothetical protein